MNDSCFKAQKEFDKAKQGWQYVQPNNFYEYQKQYKITPCLSEKAFKEYY